MIEEIILKWIFQWILMQDSSWYSSFFCTWHNIAKLFIIYHEHFPYQMLPWDEYLFADYISISIYVCFYLKQTYTHKKHDIDSHSSLMFYQISQTKIWIMIKLLSSNFSQRYLPFSMQTQTHTHTHMLTDTYIRTHMHKH